jgi:hypothetical protein
MRTKLTLAAGVLALLMPATALAYFTPDQFDSLANQNFQQPPPTAREASSVVQQRERTIGAQREAEQAALHGAAPDDPYVAPEQPNTTCLDDECQYELRQARLRAASGNQGGPTIIIGGQGGAMVYDGNGNVLHSGAPLITASGPETTVALFAFAFSLFGTMFYMWRRARLTVPVTI